MNNISHLEVHILVQIHCMVMHEDVLQSWLWYAKFHLIFGISTN